MGNRIDLTGQRFGRLTVVSEAERSKSGDICWRCKCDCGNERTIRGSNLRRGHTQSCGCLYEECLENLNKTHGMSYTRIHRIWQAMKARCLNPNVKGYSNYGGRGIRVCDEWKNNFTVFYCWAMANGYTDELTIDRIDNNGNYCPTNCRWTTTKDQANNRRTCHTVTAFGRTQNIKQWAEEYCISAKLLRNRIVRDHWSPERALTTPPKQPVSKSDTDN